MLLTYRKNYDTTTEGAGGQSAILTALSQLGEDQKKQAESLLSSFQSSLDDQKKQYEESLSEVKAQVQQISVKTDEMERSMGAIKISENKPHKSFNDALAEAMAESDTFQKFAKGEKGIKGCTLELKAFETKVVADVSTANVTGGVVYGAQYRPTIVVNQNTGVQARDLLKVTNVGPGTDFYFMRENGPGEGAPAPTAEKKAAAATTPATGLKPQFDIDLVESSVKFEIIAGFMVISRKALNNIPGLTSFLNTRLPQKLLDVESQQIWYGSGVSPEIKGILTAGNFVAGSAAGTTSLAEKIIIDLGVFEDTYKRTATNIVMRPADYWSMFRAKSAGSQEFDLPSNVVATNGQLYIGGVPVSKTTTLNAPDYVIGDFINGAELLVQEGIRVEFFEQDSTNVRTNQITVRVEEVIALPVYGPDFFMKGSSASSLASGAGGRGSRSEE